MSADPFHDAANAIARMNAHEERRFGRTEVRPMTVRGVARSALQLRPFEPDPLPKVMYANLATQIFVGCPLALTVPLHEIARPHCGGWHLGTPMR